MSSTYESTASTVFFQREANHEEIAELAYHFWIMRARPYGSPEFDWYCAEKALRETKRNSPLEAT
jgi:hypothetical protein